MFSNYQVITPLSLPRKSSARVLKRLLKLRSIGGFTGDHTSSLHVFVDAGCDADPLIWAISPLFYQIDICVFVLCEVKQSFIGGLGWPRHICNWLMWFCWLHQSLTFSNRSATQSLMPWFSARKLSFSPKVLFTSDGEMAGELERH